MHDTSMLVNLEEEYVFSELQILNKNKHWKKTTRNQNQTPEKTWKNATITSKTNQHQS